MAKFIPHCLGQRPAQWPWVFPKNGCVSGLGLRELQAAVPSWRRFQGAGSCGPGSRTLRAPQELTGSEDSGPGIQWSHWWGEAHGQVDTHVPQQGEGSGTTNRTSTHGADAGGLGEGTGEGRQPRGQQPVQRCGGGEECGPHGAPPRAQ